MTLLNTVSLSIPLILTVIAALTIAEGRLTNLRKRLVGSPSRVSRGSNAQGARLEDQGSRAAWVEPRAVWE